MDKTTILKIKDYRIKIMGANKDEFLAIAQRKSGKQFTFEEHLESLFFAILSSNYSSREVYKGEITKVLFKFDKEEILNHSNKYFSDKLSETIANCKLIPETVKTFTSSIYTFEIIEQKYGSLDNFVTSETWKSIIKFLSDPDSEYFLHKNQNIIYEYLKHVGIDCVLPSSQLALLLGCDRLGDSKNMRASDDEIINTVQSLANDSGLSMCEVYELLLEFCDKNYLNVCTDEPNCYKCIIKSECKYKMKESYSTPKKPITKPIIPDNYEYYTNNPKDQLKVIVEKWLENKADNNEILLDDCYTYKASAYRRFLTPTLSDLIPKNYLVHGKWERHNYFYEIDFGIHPLSIQLAFYNNELNHNPKRNAISIVNKIIEKYGNAKKPSSDGFLWPYISSQIVCLPPYSREKVFPILDKLYSDAMKFESDAIEYLRSIHQI